MSARDIEVLGTIGDESGLIERAKRMDDSAWRQIYEQHYNTLYAYLFYRTGNAGVAEDLAAEVFERAVKGIGGFTYRGTTVGAWLQRIAGNLLIDHHRRHSRTQPAMELDEHMPGEAVSLTARAELMESVGELQRALAQLTEEQQQVILMKFVAEMSTAEVAQQLRKSEGAIKALQHRALDTLRRLWPGEHTF